MKKQEKTKVRKSSGSKKVTNKSFTKTLPTKFKLTKKSAAVLFIGVFALVGSIAILRSFAAAPLNEPESWSTTGGNTAVRNDASASNGQYLEFLAPTPPQNNYDVAQWLTNGVDIPPLNPAEGNWPTGSLGNFRILCWPSHLNYDDPIVYPGQQGRAHLHMFFGNRNINYQTTTENITKSGDGSCQGGPLNRTGYWIPAMHDKNGKVRLPITTVFYYKTQGLDKSTIQPLPTGLRMITGNPNAMSPQNNWRIQWMCVGSGAKSDLIPTCPVGSQLKLELSFPQCGARKNGQPVLDSEDHQSHLAYREWNNVCPATHPIPYPEISLNIIWKSDDVTTQGWYLSSDKHAGMSMPGGTSTHADWFMGWDERIINTFTQRCLREGRNSNSGKLCDGTQLKMISGPNGGEYVGNRTIDPPASTNQTIQLNNPF